MYCNTMLCMKSIMLFLCHRACRAYHSGKDEERGYEDV